MSIESVTDVRFPDAAHHNHGRTLAAWVTNGGVTLGTLVAGWGFTFWDMTPIAIGGGVIVASLIAGGVLKALGHGQPSRKSLSQAGSA